jgi:hypothetical protein
MRRMTTVEMTMKGTDPFGWSPNGRKMNAAATYEVTPIANHGGRDYAGSA